MSVDSFLKKNRFVISYGIDGMVSYNSESGPIVLTLIDACADPENLVL